MAGNALSWAGDHGRMVGYWLGKATGDEGSRARRSRSFSKTSGIDPCSRPWSSTTQARAGCSRRPASSSWRAGSWTTDRRPARSPSCASASTRERPGRPSAPPRARTASRRVRGSGCSASGRSRSFRPSRRRRRGARRRQRRRRPRRGPTVRSAVLSFSYGRATARTSPFVVAKSVAPTPSTVIGRRPSTSRRNELISSCAPGGFPPSRSPVSPWFSLVRFGHLDIRTYVRVELQVQ